MVGSLNHPGKAPRVFISYARADGEAYTRNLHTRLEKAGIPCWMDRFGMEGGKDWRQQILEALDTVEFLVLVMTPAAMQSPNFQWEWRYARQRCTTWENLPPSGILLLSTVNCVLRPETVLPVGTLHRLLLQ